MKWDDLIITPRELGRIFHLKKAGKKRETTKCNSHSKPLQSCVHRARRCCCWLLHARCSLLPFYAPAMPPPNMMHRIFKPVKSVRIVCLAYSCPVCPAEVSACCLIAQWSNYSHNSRPCLLVACCLLLAACCLLFAACCLLLAASLLAPAAYPLYGSNATCKL